MTFVPGSANASDVGPEGRLKVACKDCNLFQLCLPVGLGEADLALLDRVIKRRRPLRRGEYLFRPGDPFLFIYAVKSGSFKSYTPLNNGPDQVTGFHLPGELLGLDAINARVHSCGARALETSSVCEVPLDRLEELGNVVTSVQRQMLRIMSTQIRHDHLLQVLLTKKTAAQRLAAFLSSLSERFQRRGFSAREFRLSMSRTDIGNYLGLAEETVSRLFTRFQDQRLITVAHKQLRLTNLPRLVAMAGLPKIIE